MDVFSTDMKAKDPNVLEKRLKQQQPHCAKQRAKSMKCKEENENTVP